MARADKRPLCGVRLRRNRGCCRQLPGRPSVGHWARTLPRAPSLQPAASPTAGGWEWRGILPGPGIPRAPGASLEKGGAAAPHGAPAVPGGPTWKQRSDSAPHGGAHGVLQRRGGVPRARGTTRLRDKGWSHTCRGLTPVPVQ